MDVVCPMCVEMREGMSSSPKTRMMSAMSPPMTSSSPRWSKVRVAPPSSIVTPSGEPHAATASVSRAEDGEPSSVSGSAMARASPAPTATPRSPVSTGKTPRRGRVTGWAPKPSPGRGSSAVGGGVGGTPGPGGGADMMTSLLGTGVPWLWAGCGRDVPLVRCRLLLGPGAAALGGERGVRAGDLHHGLALRGAVGDDVAELTGQAGEPLPVAPAAAVVAVHAGLDVLT